MTFYQNSFCLLKGKTNKIENIESNLIKHCSGIENPFFFDIEKKFGPADPEIADLVEHLIVDHLGRPKPL
jgi:hypothetical protein